MKKTTSLFLAVLLVIGLALLSACESRVPPVDPEEVVSLPTDESIPDDPSEPE